MADLIESFRSEDPRVWIGVITALVVFIIEIILWTKGIILSGGKKKLEKARELGHVIKGTLVSSTYNDGDSGKVRDRRYTGYYEYEVNGKKRRKVVMSSSSPTLTIWLYYTNSPRKVFTEYDVGPGCLTLLIYIIPVLAATFVMKLLGYQS